VLPVPAHRLSEAIEISGVVEVGGKTSVIVQVPNEQTSRYVHVGEYVSNGNVLVKRVEMGIEPVVILEENGTEVTRYVGSDSPSMGLL
jgi:Tfp pilus assembly protein PilP